MAENTQDRHGVDDLDREIEPKPLPGEPTEPSEPEPAGDPSKVQPANGGWGTQDVPVPAN
jgi:hypothetical protein